MIDQPVINRYASAVLCRLEHPLITFEEVSLYDQTVHCRKLENV